MPNAKKFSMDYRPESYWDCFQEGFTNIKGEMRRSTVQNALGSEFFPLLPGSLLSDEICDEERLRMGAVHPAFMGGEYLPSYLPGELEIARVSLESVTWDVISIRARRIDSDWIAYRVVDEYEAAFKCRPEKSRAPLTMGEIISLIDTAEGPVQELVSCRGLTDSYREFNYQDYETLDHLNILVSFVRVSSFYYPDLERWYEEEAQEWYRKRLAKLEEDEAEFG